MAFGEKKSIVTYIRKPITNAVMFYASYSYLWAAMLENSYTGGLSSRLAFASATTIGLALKEHAYRKFDYNNHIIIIHNSTMFMLSYLSTQH